MTSGQAQAPVEDFRVGYNEVQRIQLTHSTQPLDTQHMDYSLPVQPHGNFNFPQFGNQKSCHSNSGEQTMDLSKTQPGEHLNANQDNRQQPLISEIATSFSEFYSPNSSDSLTSGYGTEPNLSSIDNGFLGSNAEQAMVENEYTAEESELMDTNPNLDNQDACLGQDITNQDMENLWEDIEDIIHL